MDVHPATWLKRRWRPGIGGRTRIATTLACLLLIVLTIGPAAHAVARSAWGSSVAFVRFSPENGHPEIYTTSPTYMGTARPLPLSMPAAIAPAWSPDGRTIAFIGGKSNPDTGDITHADAVYLADARGTRTRRLTHWPGHVHGLAWDPSGKRLLVVRAPVHGSGSSLWTIGVNGRGARRITHGHVDLEPSWSADGRTIAFLRIDPATYHSQIWLARPDGSGQRPILRNMTAVTEPVWSPRQRLLLVEDGRALYTVQPDGSHRRLLVHLAADKQGSRVDPRAAWSPDGRQVVFDQMRTGSVRISDLWIVGANGRGLRRLTHSSGQDSAPTWGP